MYRSIAFLPLALALLLPWKARAEELRDILPPLPLPGPHLGPLPLPDPQDPVQMALLALILLALPTLALFLFFRRRRTIKISPPLPAETVALADLAAAHTLRDQGRAEAYAERLSEILRRYLESRFQLHSRSRTSREFLAELGRSEASTILFLQDHRHALEECLVRCDLAKFARRVPAPEELAAMERTIRSCIEATRSAPQEKEGS